MALTLIVVTNQIRYIRVNKKKVYKRINKEYNKEVVIKEKYKKHIA